jgi:capsular polysaccharide biosynthesis protein
MASFLASWFQPRKKTNKNRVFLLGMPLVKNYHLWLHYALPRLMFWEKLSDRGEIPVLISKNSPKFVFQSLDYYAALNRDFRFIALSRQELRVEQLFLAEPLGFRDTPHPRAIEWLRHRFLQTSDASSRRALYVTRKGALERDVANEQAILDILEPLGFQIFDPTKHTFVEQVKTFSQARVVVGPHGAAFANMAFAPLGSRLIELIGGSHLLPCFRYLMQMINGNYDALQCDSVEQHLFINAIQQAKLAQYLQKMAK